MRREPSHAGTHSPYRSYLSSSTSLIQVNPIMKFLATIAVIAATVSAAPAAATPKVLICSDSTTANYNTTTSVLQGYADRSALKDSVLSHTEF